MKTVKFIPPVIIILTIFTIELSAKQGSMGMYMDRDKDGFRRPMMMRRGIMNKGMMGGKCYGDPEHMRNILKLTEKQITKIGYINEKYKTRLITYRDKLFPKKQRLRKLLLNKKINFGRLKNILKSISNIEIEIRLIKIKQRLEIEKILILH